MRNILRLLALSVLISCNPVIAPTPETIPSQIPVDVVAPSGATEETYTPAGVVPKPVVVEEEVPHVASKPIGEVYPVAEVKKVFTVKIVDTNYTPEQKKKLREAEKIIERLFNSELYKKEVLSRTFTSTKLSSEKVFEKLFGGAEALQPALNYQLDLKVTMYYKKLTKVVGYTTPSSLIVYTNSKFHSYYTACQVASNLVHEWTHKMGFDHATASDAKSVPYSHNQIVEKFCKG